MDPIIETRGLTREFRSAKKTLMAVDDLDLRVEAGEMVALLGPNGAGKSTTLRMLTTLLAPTSGTARVAGHDVTREPSAVRRAIGYVGQGNSAGHAQRVRDELVTSGRAYGLDRARSHDRADALLEAFGLSDHARSTVGTLSGGQRRRLDIAMGLVHEPGVLFLDEPSTGLDPQARANLSEHVLALQRDHGTTVVLTTHYLDEADALAERIVVIDHGRVVADDDPSTLKDRYAADRITLSFIAPEDARRAADRLVRAHHEAAVELRGDQLTASLPDGSVHAPHVLADLVVDGLSPASVEVVRPTLDDVFLALTGRSLREGRSAAQPTPTEPTTPEVAA